MRWSQESRDAPPTWDNHSNTPSLLGVSRLENIGGGQVPRLVSFAPFELKNSNYDNAESSEPLCACQVSFLVESLVLCSAKRWSPTFLAPGPGLVEDSFPQTRVREEE